MLKVEELKRKQIVVFGLRGTGKTTFVKWLLEKFKHPFVFDTLNEYKDFNRYVPDTREAGEPLQLEFATFWKNILKNKIDCLAVDEANRIMP